MKAFLTQVARFGLVGLLNTAVGLGIIWTAMAFGVPPLPANAIGFACGLVVSFTLNRAWTFKDNNRTGGLPKHALKFFLAFLVAYSLNFLALWLGLQHTSTSPYLLQVVGNVVYTISFFILCRVWVFAAPQPKDA